VLERIPNGKAALHSQRQQLMLCQASSSYPRDLKESINIFS
jgi:hypothetical protein